MEGKNRVKLGVLLLFKILLSNAVRNSSGLVCRAFTVQVHSLVHCKMHKFKHEYMLTALFEQVGFCPQR